ncbi:MAG: hypothetical protein JNL73_21440, partial [Anaerolineales bacterium]|nr:hypothetical protein [Anaerolineales bacterium]
SVIARALAKPREERFATAGALSDALGEAVGLRETRRLTPPPESGATLLPDLSATGYAQPDAAAEALARIRAATPVPRPLKRRWSWPVLALIGAGVFGALLLGIAITGFALSRLAVRTATPVAAASPTLAVVTSPPTAAPATATTGPTTTPAATATATLVPLAIEPISIASIVNGTLTNDYAAPPVGRVELGGVLFDLDGQAFRSQAAPAPNNGFPTQAGLDLDLIGVERVFVLITAGDAFTRWQGERVGQIVLTFAGAEPVAVDLVLGENLREWHPADNVVSTAPGVSEVWTGPITGFPNLTAHLDLLTIAVPADRAAARLTRIDFVDLSAETVGSRDPALTVAGLAIEHR